MAPEVMRHEMYDTRADVYSWGVLFAEILQQQPPYEGLYCTPMQVCAVSTGKMPFYSPLCMISIRDEAASDANLNACSSLQLPVQGIPPCGCCLSAPAP